MIVTHDTRFDALQNRMIVTHGTWFDVLDKRAQREVDFAILYARDFAHGAIGHNSMLAIAAMAAELDRRDSVCGVGCCCGKNGELLICGLKPGHAGDHAFAGLPSFTSGSAPIAAADWLPGDMMIGDTHYRPGVSDRST